MIEYLSQVLNILDSSRVQLSDLRPSEWAEQNIVMGGAFPGPLSYKTTPYTRAIIDHFAADDPVREIALMGAAQFGKTASIIIPVIGYIIANNPGPIIMTVGHDDLIEEAMMRVDAMLDSTGLRKIVKSSAQRAKSQKTGDTNTMKEFPRGFFKLSAASNPKIWRQVSYQFGLLDDYEAVKSASKVAGSTRSLILKRFTTYDKKKKILYCSSPEVKQASNIYEVYLLGDQRKFMIPCPCCGTFIELIWEVKGKNGEMAGITWQLDSDNLPIPESIGYTCQECGDFFTDQMKSDWVNKGHWKPTAKASRPDLVSYQLNSLYSPAGMSDWESYIYTYLEANPPGLPRIESKWQTFLNLDLGLPYEATGEAPKANELQKNAINYEINLIPEKVSVSHGNGEIVLITLACDLNGTVNDARLDWEIVAWSESGSSYSIKHGSIGTFVPREGSKKNKEDRVHWTYEMYRSNSVWPELTKIIEKVYETESGRKMKIFITGIDCGHYTNYAYDYIDKSNNFVVGLKGKDGDKAFSFGADIPTFKPAKERSNLFLVEVNQVKDDLAHLIKLKYDRGNDDIQPPGFMNFPLSAEGLYQFSNFFEHYEAEHRVIVDKQGVGIAAVWEKKNTNVQNHFWDVRVYNMALKDIYTSMFCREAKIKNYSWKDYVDGVMGRL